MDSLEGFVSVQRITCRKHRGNPVSTATSSRAPRQRRAGPGRAERLALLEDRTRSLLSDGQPRRCLLHGLSMRRGDTDGAPGG